MEINVYPFPSAVSEKQCIGKTAIVIDVLRATTTITEALINGASQIVPARDAAEAMALASQLGRRDSIIAGESGGLKLPGFDLGNSPFEFDRTTASGKTIVFCTSNGTGAIRAARSASHLLLGSFRNYKAAAKKASGYGDDIIIICAGTDAEASLDDIVAAGAIITSLIGELKQTPDVNDFARLSVLAYDAYKRGELSLELASHYKTLMKLGFERDIAFCLEEDKTQIVPVYENGSIR